MNRTKKLKTAFLLALVACVAAASVVYYYMGKERRIVYSHRNDHHPIINSLFERDIKRGQPLEELLGSWPTPGISKHDNFATLYYLKNPEEYDPCCWDYSVVIRIIAKDNKLVKALAIEGILSEIEYVFFDGLDPLAEDVYWTSRLQHATR